MPPLIAFVVTLLVIAILFWCVQRILMALRLGEPITTVVYVVFALLVCIYLVGVITGRSWLGVF